jgi:hypothetical protein
VEDDAEGEEQLQVGQEEGQHRLHHLVLKKFSKCRLHA